MSPKTKNSSACDKDAKKKESGKPGLGLDQVTEIVMANHALKTAKKQLEIVVKDLEELEKKKEKKKKKLEKEKESLTEEVDCLKKALQKALKPVK
ncbi:Ff.00g002670.m01.CDS01 [Fusarium sp. VM40]|nr:Ff.00g002670.m01.CDS01 [Fusarium sp. VM40]